MFLSQSMFSLTYGSYCLAFHSVVIACFEWWLIKLVILFTRNLSYSQLKTSILLVYFVVVALHYSTPYSFGVTASTQISNELGVENPNTTDLAALFVMVLGVAKEIIISQLYFILKVWLNVQKICGPICEMHQGI